MGSNLQRQNNRNNLQQSSSSQKEDKIMMLSRTTTTTREVEIKVERKAVLLARAKAAQLLINENEMLRKNFATRTGIRLFEGIYSFILSLRLLNHKFISTC